ncbi:protein decapping 5 isoform X1 [Coffea arabica]|uniref:Protein decapping 5 isoform X1 n=1 Tax=Coffea arabica TaxID=13443 RepID=A0A6P6U4U0_COFAR|nr:protein decapping 5-like isoform X1 [Coffea arabica]
MAKESSDGKTATAPPPASSSAADSYIGSFISLTSKYEIRYEGVLYYLNPQDSTLGLKNVKSYGTEGRKKDGPQIPPSDKVYEYILFRGSDIKDLQVKSSPPAHVDEPIHNDPAIIQSQFATGPSSSAKPVPASSGSLTNYSPYMEAAAPNMRSYPGIMSSQPSGAQLVAHGPSQSPLNTSFSSYAMPMPLQGYGGATSGNGYAQEHQNLSATNSVLTLKNFVEAPPMQASTTIGSTNSPFSPPLVPSLIASNVTLPNTVSSLTPEQLSMQPMNLPSLPTNSALSFPPGMLNANTLNMSSVPSLVQNVNNNEATNIGMVVSDPGKNPAVSVSSAASSFGPLLKQSSILLTPDQFSQPRVAEIATTQSVFPVQKDTSALNSVSSNSLSSITPAATQAPLLPLQQPRQEFTEEFDFEAMNEKFKKDEVWGYLGKAKHRDNMESLHDDTIVCQTSGDQEGDGLATEADSKPAYNKDDFFDSISCNTTSRRGRNGQNRFSDRMKLDTETFGQFQQRNYPVYGGYGTGRGMNRNPYGWGRGYNPSGRGRGGYMR